MGDDLHDTFGQLQIALLSQIDHAGPGCRDESSRSTASKPCTVLPMKNRLEFFFDSINYLAMCGITLQVKSGRT